MILFQEHLYATRTDNEDFRFPAFFLSYRSHACEVVTVVLKILAENFHFTGNLIGP